MAINGAVIARKLHLDAIIFGRQQTVDVKSRNTFQPQHNGMRADKAINLPFIPAFHGSTERIKQTDINFVRLNFVL